MKQKLLVLFVITAGLGTALFFFVNSPLFIKQFVLPKIADELHMNVSTGDLSFSIFDGITINDLEIRNKNDVLLKAKLIKIKYFWKAALNKKIIINEIFVEDGLVHIIKDHDGNLNLPELPVQSESVSNDTPKTTNFPVLIINNFSIKNCQFIYDDKMSQSSYSFNKIDIHCNRVAVNESIEVTFTTSISTARPTLDHPLSCDAEISLTAVLNQSFLPDEIQLNLGVKSINGRYQSIDLTDRRLDFELAAHVEDERYRINTLNLIEYDNGKENMNIAGSGIVAMTPISGDFNVSMSLNDLDFIKRFHNLDSSVEIEGSLNYNTHIVVSKNVSKLDLTGSLNAEELTIKSSTSDDQPDPLRLQINYGLTVKPEEKTFRIRELDIVANDGSNDVLTCALGDTLTISLLTDKPDIQQPATFNLGINQFRNALVAGLCPKIENISLSKSLTSGKLELTVLSDGSDLHGVGKLNVTDIFYKHKDENLKFSGYIGYNLNLKESFTKSVINDASLEFFIDEESAFHVKAGGKLNLDKMSGELEFTTIKLNSALKRLLPESIHKKYDLGNLNTNGTFNLNFSEKLENVNCRGELSISDFKIENLSTLRDNKLAGRVNIDAGFNKNGTLNLNSLSSSLNVNGSVLGDMTASGNFSFSQSDKSGCLEVKSNTAVDVEEILDFANSITEISNSDAAVNTQLDSNASRDNQIDQNKSTRTNPLPEFSFEAMLDIPVIKYKSLKINELKSHISANQSSVKIVESSLKCDDGDISFSGECNILDLNNPEFSGRLSIKNLDVMPILSSISNDAYGILSGTIADLQCKISGSGTEPKIITDTIRGEMKCSITDLDCSETLLKHKELMSLLGIDAQDQIFDSIVIDVKSKSQNLTVNSLELRNKMFNLNGKGNFAGPQFLPDMMITIGYSGRNVERAEKLKIHLTKSKDGFHYTRPIPFKSASWEPKYLLGKWFPSIANDLLDLDDDDQATVQGIQTVGDVISGDKSVKEAIGSIFEILKNRELKKLEESEKSENLEMKDILNSFMK